MDKRSQLRTQLKTRRNALSVSEQNLASIKVAKSLSENKKIKQANKIAVYLSNDGELDTTAFIEWCWQEKKSVFFTGGSSFLNWKPAVFAIQEKY
jgi:5-formyltetrahydrofolate cyclo-ligase